jgi:hypothetical protein
MKKISLFLGMLCICCWASAYWVPSGDANFWSEGVMDITHDNEAVYLIKGETLMAVDKNTGGVSVYEGLSHPRSLFMHGDTLLIGCEKEVAFLHEGQLGTYLEFPEALEAILSMAFDSKGVFYATSYYDLFRYDGSQRTTVQILSPIFDDYNCQIRVDGEDGVWLSNFSQHVRQGLQRYTSEEGLVSDFGVSVGFGLALDPIGRVWVGCIGKLVCLDGDAVTTYSVDANLVDMEFDSEGTLWGISDSNTSSLQRTLWSFHDGTFTSHPCDIGSERWVSLDIDGDAIYVGTVGRLLKYQAGQYTEVDLTEVSTSFDPVTMSNRSKASQPSVYDLQGRRLRARPSHGVYIQDGKKMR